MIYITGDMHGDISQMRQVMQKINCKPNNTLIVLGDFGANYYFDKKDDIFKNAISEYNINIFVIRGNHDGNPSLIEGVEQKEKYDNIGYIEQKYSNIFYAINGNIYNIEKNQFLVLGGAYSVDKFYRLSMGYKWFSDEQMTAFSSVEGSRPFTKRGLPLFWILKPGESRKTCEKNIRERYW